MIKREIKAQYLDFHFDTILRKTLVERMMPVLYMLVLSYKLAGGDIKWLSVIFLPLMLFAVLSLLTTVYVFVFAWFVDEYLHEKI